MSFKRNYSFNKGHPGYLLIFQLDYFCFSENVIQKICESKEKQLDVIMIALVI